jgi:hypothetical protein
VSSTLERAASAALSAFRAARGLVSPFGGRTGRDGTPEPCRPFVWGPHAGGTGRQGAWCCRTCAGTSGANIARGPPHGHAVGAGGAVPRPRRAFASRGARQSGVTRARARASASRARCAARRSCSSATSGTSTRRAARRGAYSAGRRAAMRTPEASAPSPDRDQPHARVLDPRRAPRPAPPRYLRPGREREAVPAHGRHAAPISTGTAIAVRRARERRRHEQQHARRGRQPAERLNALPGWSDQRPAAARARAAPACTPASASAAWAADHPRSR